MRAPQVKPHRPRAPRVPGPVRVVPLRGQDRRPPNGTRPRIRALPRFTRSRRRPDGHLGRRGTVRRRDRGGRGHRPGLGGRRALRHVHARAPARAVALPELITRIRGAVPLPVIATGGLAGPADVADVLAAGEEAAMAGTALLRTDKSAGVRAAQGRAHRSRLRHDRDHPRLHRAARTHTAQSLRRALRPCRPRRPSGPAPPHRPAAQGGHRGRGHPADPSVGGHGPPSRDDRTRRRTFARPAGGL